LGQARERTEVVKVLDKILIPGRGLLVRVGDAPAGLKMGDIVELDGLKHEIKGVEAATGGPMALLVEKLENIDARYDVLDRRVLAQGKTHEEWAVEVIQPVEGVWRAMFYCGCQGFTLAHCQDEDDKYAEQHVMFIARQFVKALQTMRGHEMIVVDSSPENADSENEKLAGGRQR
jgi:hypothetical protein